MAVIGTPSDVTSSPRKTYLLASGAARIYRAASQALAATIDLSEIPIAAASARLVAARDAKPEDLDARAADLDAAIDALLQAGRVPRASEMVTR